jgi:hypothetical protein
MCSFDWSTIHTLLFFGRFCGMLSFQILPCICLNTQHRVRAMSPIYLLYVISDIHLKKTGSHAANVQKILNWYNPYLNFALQKHLKLLWGTWTKGAILWIEWLLLLNACQHLYPKCPTFMMGQIPFFTGQYVTMLRHTALAVQHQRKWDFPLNSKNCICDVKKRNRKMKKESVVS